MNYCAFRIATVNKALARAGYNERLARGRGYFYFVGGNTRRWDDVFVYAERLDRFTPEQWVAVRNQLANQ
jgi:hypothetical protein